MLHRFVLSRLCRARDRLRETGDAKLSIAAIAREAGLSTYHFIRLFQSVFGATPHQFRIQARLERAQRLLAAGHSVTEVCMEVGFSSVGTFSHLFAKRVGVSPSVFRAQQRALAAVPGRLEYELYPSCFTLMAGPAGAAIFEKRARAALADSSRHRVNQRSVRQA